MQRRKNNYIILGLCMVLVLMGIGYAAFSSQLNITGTSNITSNWDVRITNIESELNGATDLEAPTYDNTNGLYASFHTGLSKPGDYALYTVTIENRGDIDARIEKINSYYQENEYVTFTLSGLSKGDVIGGSETKELQVRVEFNSEVTSIPGDIDIDLDVDIDVAQDSDNPLPADEYYIIYDYTTNGGEGSNAVNDYVAENTNVNLSYTASKTGYEFMGWNTDKDAVTGLESYPMPANNTILYAIFRKIDTTPPVIDNVSTTSTTNSITVVTTATEADGEITKYEYKIDNNEYVEGSNTYTFTGLTQNTSHTIKVRVTNRDNLQVESEEKQASTSVLDKPTFSEEETDNGKTVTITYPEGEELIYEYQKDSGEWQTATQGQQVEFTESGTLVARVSDGTNTETATYSVEIISSGADGVIKKAGIVTSGDGLYLDIYEKGVYTYKGSNPNNYVSFNDGLWRILNVNTNDNTIKIIANDLSTTVQVFDAPEDRKVNGEYCDLPSNGCNIWGSRSTLYDVNMNKITEMAKEIGGVTYTLPRSEASINKNLNSNIYSKYNEEARNMMVSGIFKVGLLETETGQTLDTDINLINAVKWKGRVGLIDVTEFVRANSNPECTGVNNYRDCSNSKQSANYLGSNAVNSTWWTITPCPSSSSNYVWYVSFTELSTGIAGHTSTTVISRRKVRPVVTLSPSVKITSGDGSESSPYQLSLD